ncbi:hypothetical protein ACCT04_34945, partial [Rhizobium ruizarguesonis]
VLTPNMFNIDRLGPGEIGFITASIKEVSDTRVGDTITEDKRPTAQALPGFKPAQPVVFCGLFPVDASDFEGEGGVVEAKLAHGGAQILEIGG